MSRSYLASGRIPDQRRKILEEAAEAHRGKALVSQPDTESLNGIGYDACVIGAKLIDLLGC
jgi:hypothetical protein